MGFANITSLARNDGLRGHLFIRPALWLEHQVEVLRSPLLAPEESLSRAAEIAHRISCLASLILFPLIAASFVIGLAIKLWAPQASTESTNATEEATSHDSIHAIEERLLKMIDYAPLRGEVGREILGQITSLKQQFGPISDPKGNTYLKHVETMFQVLVRTIPGSFYIEAQRAGNLTDSNILQVPSDGNCFFHAMSKGLIMLKDHIRWHQAAENHATLRPQIVNWMRENVASDPVLRQYIAEAIEAFQAVKATQHQDQEATLMAIELGGEDVSEARRALAEEKAAVDAMDQGSYLDMIARDGFFASNAERYAIANIYGITVGVQRRIPGVVRLLDLDPDIGVGSKKITLVLVDGNHFDLKIS